jgi:hypothetical protein
MAIHIICPGCHSRFSVSEQFAGKQGPCPKCKTVITIPKAGEEVKIHAPDDYGGAKSTTGQLVLKPIERSVTRLSTTWVLAIGAATIITIGVAFMIGRAYPPEVVASNSGAAAGPQRIDPTEDPMRRRPVIEPADQGPTSKSTVPTPLLGLGAILLSFPLVLAGYSFLRNDEMEPYRRSELWTRAAICAFVFALLWGVYWLFGYFGVLDQSPTYWMFAGPVFFVVGGAAGYLALDLEFGSAALLYAFYLVVTVGLRMIMGLNPV